MKNINDEIIWIQNNLKKRMKKNMNALGIMKTLEWNEMIEVEEREKNDWHSINQMRIEKEM